ncbi:expressed protein [Phakopsora pachyrhizi]|uniref:Expressed protein n=1 Tax=Phakopsora pachyrhizi TaxID=170000 RepID=A0AAV0BAV5_PHAPC|nr:expressed protein [Phakopsora pachyrhizi]
MEQYASAELPSGDESVTFFKGLSQIDNSAEALKQASFDRSLSQTPTGEVTLPDPDQKESHGLNEKIGSPEKPLTLCGTPIDLEGAEEQRGPKVEGEPRTVRFFEEDERESLSNEGYSHAKKCLGHLCQEGNEDEIEPNVLQIYLSYFDLNQNGKLDPIDTWRALRRIGFSIWISIIISIIAHIIGSSISRKGKWFIPDIFGRLQVTIPRESLTKRSGLLSTFAFKLQSDQNLALSYERLGPREIWQLTHKQINSEGNRDFRALFRLILQYILVVSLTWKYTGI